jgi:catalase
MVRNAYTLRRDDDDFGQPGTLWREVLSETDRDHLVDNIVGHLSNEVTDPVVARAIDYWSAVDPQLGARVAAGLGRGDGAGNGASEHGRPAQASAPSPRG